MKKLSPNQFGFTLVELLVAIVIIVILTTIGIASFNSANRRNELQNQAKAIVSQMRKIRTDSVAASKPTTGTTAGTSCKSPDGTPDQSVFYGTFITFSNSTFSTGVTCFVGAATDVSGGASTPVTLKSGMSLSFGLNRTIFFGFDGNVYTINGAAPASVATVPTTGAITNPITITITQGSDTYNIRMNGTGLVCTQISTTATNCAQ